MLFTSPVFFVLLLVTFFIYYLPFFKRHQVFVLIVSSLVFYAYHTPALLVLFLGSVTINSIISYKIFWVNNGKERLFASLSVIFNLSLLAFFKYNDLLFGTLLKELSRGSNSLFDFLSNIPLPIGISFYTFEGISLVVDVFREKKAGNDSHIVKGSFSSHTTRTLFFVSFFPHLIAGPILKAQEFYPQISAKSLIDIDWKKVFESLVTGYFLKMVVADQLKDQTFWLYYPNFMHFSTFSNLMLLYGYSMQIFADFAGYSLIAIGLAALFGYQFPPNFNFPYISKSFAEFWRRWHISLSTWLREYLYFPLGGNRKGRYREYLHLMIVMFLGGLWHGGAWSYAIWGGFHGIVLAGERALKGKWMLPNLLIFKVLKLLFVFTFVTFAWLLFKLPHFDHALAFFNSLWQNRGKGVYFSATEGAIVVYSLPVVVYHIHYIISSRSQPSAYLHFVQKAKPLVWGLLIFLLLLNSGAQGDFIYFQF